MSIYARRLLDVAKACRESLHASKFNMHCEVHYECGTPGCAVGNYAARPDLQDVFTIGRDAGSSGYTMRIYGKPSGCFWIESPACDYFGITPDEGNALFGSRGCADAQTTIEAAEYIEGFVAKKWGVDPAVRQLESTLATSGEVPSHVY